MQNFEKILLSMSSVVTSPMISPMASIALRKSRVINSPLSLNFDDSSEEDNPSFALSNAE
jgi:hypothetical protein